MSLRSHSYSRTNIPVIHNCTLAVVGVMAIILLACGMAKSLEAKADVAVDNPPDWAKRPPAEDVLRDELLTTVAEIALGEPAIESVKGADAIWEARQRIINQAKTIAEQIKENPDAFVQELIAKRPDLAGLPWRMRQDSQLTPTQAKTLQVMSLAVREALDKLHDIDDFWCTLDLAKTDGASTKPAGISVMDQLLMVENASIRRSFVLRLDNIKGTQATVALAQRAVFDLELHVRIKAIHALRVRPAEEYLSVLLDALSHPWPVAAQNAAVALVKLKAAPAAPQLVQLLKKGDPTLPFLDNAGGKVPVMRELVRVNHLRNCLMCHAPTTASGSAPEFAPIPVPGVSLPTSATAYYQTASNVARVRSDVTYLKQDFSVMQPVSNPGVWPKNQRYDYLVRVRPLDAKEHEAFTKNQAAPKPLPLSKHQEAILYALRELTGRDVGTSPQAWQQVISEMKR